eukprot:TRINITY_DN82456_c0_g1_i1.p1 TRINITY_DN82456_c0_g1~~TRINITY_DN82456_c0_g1_i1.p1  ORF type:complete len:226 (-),score=70.73 TRINITY_DN82456_c0_g1_i1:33-611(-)
MASDMTLHGTPQPQGRKKDQKTPTTSVDSALRAIYGRARPDLSTPIERTTPSPQPQLHQPGSEGGDAGLRDESIRQQHPMHDLRVGEGRDSDAAMRESSVDRRERQRIEYEKTIEGISLESKEAMGLVEARRIISKPGRHSPRFDGDAGPTISRPVIHIRRYVLRLREEDEAAQKKTALVQIVLGRGTSDDS